MRISIYNDTDSPLHRMNPAAKICALIMLFVWAATFTHPAYCLAPLALVVVLTVVGRAGGNVARLWMYYLALLILSTVIWGAFKRGTTLWHAFGPVQYYDESILFGLGLGIRLIAMLAAGVVFLTTTRIEEFGDGLRNLSVPYPIAFALTLAFRLVPDFASTTATIVQAQQLRGLDLTSGSLLQRARKFVPLLVPIFITAIRRIDLLAMALESRGFSPTRVRTQHRSYRMTARDYVPLGVMFAVCVCSYALRTIGAGMVKVH